MVYADMTYYTDEYLGALITEDDWARLAMRSSSYIDYITMGRAKKEVDKWKTQLANACCALAEQYLQVETAQKLAQKSLSTAFEFSGNVEMQSETVGSWTKSYRSGGATAISAASAMTTAKTELYNIAAQYLATTGLLYRGRCTPCPCSPIL
jgi:wobble nucleotide-excising tRNase